MEIFDIPNADKTNHHPDAHYPGLLPSHPARIIFAGRSGCGKGISAKNLLARANPPFQRIVLYHYDCETKEWADCCDPKDTITELPEDPASFWNRDLKNLLIVDEVPFEGMPREERSRVDRMFNYVCSHYGVTVYLLQQNFVSIPVPVRRAADWWVLYRSVDAISIRDVSAKTGHDFADLLRLCETKYDSITFDHSGNGPELRLNMFNPIVERN